MRAVTREGRSGRGRKGEGFIGKGLEEDRTELTVVSQKAYPHYSSPLCLLKTVC